jgi:carboxylate-amine ligase
LIVRSRQAWVTPLPQWRAKAPLTARDWRERFSHADPYRIGLEDEVFLHDEASGDLAWLPQELRAQIEEQAGFASELPAGQIEIITPPCKTVPTAMSYIARGRSALASLLAGTARPLAAGTHPTARLPLRMTPRTRYREIEDEYAWAARRGLAAGLHVHVSVPGADRAVAVHDALRSYVPLLTALASNAPFLEGTDTGLASVRPKICEGLPRQGLPPALGNLEGLVRLLEWGAASGAFPDSSHLWWEVRLNSQHGTLELRAPDTQTCVDHAEAIAALAHALIVSLAERFDSGETLAVHDQVRLEENRWRALRHGVHGYTANPVSGVSEPVSVALERLIDELMPVARRLGCERGLGFARGMLANNGSDRQREIACREGPDALVDWLVRETVNGSTSGGVASSSDDQGARDFADETQLPTA